MANLYFGGIDYQVTKSQGNMLYAPLLLESTKMNTSGGTISGNLSTGLNSATAIYPNSIITKSIQFTKPSNITLSISARIGVGTTGSVSLASWSTPFMGQITINASGTGLGTAICQINSNIDCWSGPNSHILGWVHDITSSDQRYGIARINNTTLHINKVGNITTGTWVIYYFLMIPPS